MRAASWLVIAFLAACGRTGLVDLPPEEAERDAGCLPPGLETIPASVIITADDQYRLWVNGALIDDTPRHWASPQTYSVRLRTDPRARNVIAIEGTNRWNQGGLDRGVLAHVQWAEATPPQGVVTDAAWRVHTSPLVDWFLPDVDDSSWTAATEVATSGDWPWASITAIAPTAGWLWSYVPSGPASAKPTDETIALRRTFSLDAKGLITTPAPPCP